MERQPTGRLALAEQHVDTTLAGEKTLTARYDFERNLTIGQTIWLETPDGERFATARVTRVTEETVGEFVAAQHDGHQTYEAPAELLDEMTEYYPEADLSPKTPLILIWFDDVTPTE